jgi:hypothetical protein
MPTTFESTDALDGASYATAITYKATESVTDSAGNPVIINQLALNSPIRLNIGSIDSIIPAFRIIDRRGYILTCITGVAYFQLGQSSYTGTTSTGSFPTPPTDSTPFDWATRVRLGTVNGEETYTIKLTAGQTHTLNNYSGELWGALGTSETIFRVTTLRG